MIFVIAGWPSFEGLIKEIDRIAPELGETVVAQIGNGVYIPKTCKWFRFKTPLYSYYKKADIIISHHGAGTIFEALKYNKKLVCVENSNAISSTQKLVHNPDLVNELGKEGYLISCPSINELGNCITLARKRALKKYKSEKCGIADKIIEYLGRS